MFCFYIKHTFNEVMVEVDHVITVVPDLSDSGVISCCGQQEWLVSSYLNKKLYGYP